MKQLRFAKPHNLSQLHDELEQAHIPGLASEPGDPPTASYTLGEDADGAVVLWVPDDTDEKAITTIVNAHVPHPSAPPAPEVEARVATALQQAAALPVTSLAEANAKINAIADAVRQALLG